MMKRVLFCFEMPHGTYCGGVAAMVNSYMEKSDVFNQCGIESELFDYIAPEICEKLPSKISNVLYGILQCKALIKRLRNNNVNAVHIHTSCQFLYLKDVWLASVIKRKRNIPVYITIHVGAAETVFKRIGFTSNATIGWINKYVDKVIFLSDGIREEFMQLGMEPERGVTLGNFHDLATVPDGQELPAKAKLHLLFVGAIHRDKGIIELLTALTELHDTNFHLDVCGTLTDQSIQSEFEALVSKLGNRVTLHGYVKGQEKSSLFQRADVLVLPSYHEGFPLVILEALAGGCAIISTPVGATPEVLNESNVLWVNIGSSEDIRCAVTKLSKDNTLLEAMKRENLNLSEEFSVESHIQKLCHIYDA